ncbi:MAG TPA: PaaI family thioesterase [Ottowia sp.]|uniref:PaaI family thioesterase n=1 Tax=Ottowia sp. TaxID=1898956 RepID=UPI002C512D30|nr:PaaI family thioesterase [Ottowia sp.]HMN21120.1 PaaI family thioesterase [Ottowia sp.]
MTQPVHPSDPQLLELGRRILAEQGFSVLLGAHVEQLGVGHCELQLPVTDALMQQHGFVHGGVVSYCADNALTYAGGTALGVPVVTSEYKINYVRPARGERLIARARAEHVGRSQAVCRCEVFMLDAGVEKLCALAQGTIAALPPAKP